MNTKNSMMTFALIGAAAGTLAWFLLGTKEGRKQLDRANDGIRELTSTIRKTAKEGINKASKLADKASREMGDLQAQAKNKGQEAIRKADRMAKDGLDSANDRIKAAAQKAGEEI
ncbi:hypothetical protein SAMN05421747_101306 [Parapedobacter composti]|uniref:YtxH-like protein n=1 Tax=Parapedobacter composti TaxID=623281 RepID=A0A1I1E422_9SPHI|nr:hypothetical protein [Parapedobacter composti]SFB81827.1 hypothetical protein SAMN05421747_101306 [Parapedobacter composti]